MTDTSEKHEFQAEVNRLMDIIINSLYTDEQVFLRELISNSADALEKARFHSVQDESYLGDAKDLEMKIEFDADAKTISIIDTGIGMSKADLINNLGTVAKSGTTNFLEAMADGADANLIGQFGVGFYSAFLIADKVTVVSKNNDDPVQHVWESTADASFTVVDDPRGNTLGRGTRVTLHLKEDAHDFLSEDKLKETSKKFSQFIQYPIYMKVKKEVDADVEEDDDDDDKDDEEKDDVDVKDEDEDKDDDEKEKKPTKKTVYEWEQVNTQKAIWLRAKEDVTEDEYNEFYKSISKDYLDPLAYTHFNAEGEIEFKSILFLPKKAPFDMMDNYWQKKSEIKLYVRRVLVADKFEDLLPRYLNFVRGVVDSDDLPLNVSREQLQQNKIIKVISKKLVRKVLELMKKLAKEDDSGESEDEDEEKEEKEDKEESEDEDEEKEEKEKKDEESTWSKFYKEFAKNLKMGCYEDDSNRSKISKLLRFTTNKADKEISLDKYLDRMSESQESIYYMAGESMDVMMKSPNLQVFKKKDLEVLMLTDHLDESCIQKLADYEGKKFVSIQKADVKIDETDDEKKRFSKLKDMYKPLTDWWKDKLSDLTEKGALKDTGVKIESVAVSKRLTESPVVVVTSQFGYSAQQEKVMKAQSFQNKEQVGQMSGRKTLEINANHPVVADLLAKVKADKDDKAALDSAQVLFQTALLEFGYEIADPSALVNRVYRLMSKELGVDPDAPIKEVEVPEGEEEEEEAEEEEEESEEKDDEEEKKEEL